MGEALIKGELPMTSGVYPVDVSKLTPGLYHLTVYTEDSVKSVKFIHQ